MTTGSGKHLEDISHAPIVSLMYKLISSAEDTEDLSEDFDNSRNKRRDELASNENIKNIILELCTRSSSVSRTSKQSYLWLSL